MEGSRALSRCLQQLSIHNQSCLRTHTVASTTRCLRAQRNSSRYTNKLPPSSRPFSSSCVTRQKEDSTSAPQDAQSTPQPRPTAQQSSPLHSPTNRSIDLSSVIDNPDYKPPARRVRTQPEAPVRNVDPATRAAMAQKIGSQLDALVAGERSRAAAARRPSNYDTYGTGGTLFNQTRAPTRPAGPTPSSSELTNDLKSWVNSPIDPVDQKLLADTRELARAREQLRLHPSLGKSVDVNESAGFGVTRAFITLEARINGRGNAVKKEEREQKFHVRRGQKKKLKARDRWRIVFKEGFLGECARVRKMIRQGW